MMEFILIFGPICYCIIAVVVAIIVILEEGGGIEKYLLLKESCFSIFEMFLVVFFLPATLLFRFFKFLEKTIDAYKKTKINKIITKKYFCYKRKKK